MTLYRFQATIKDKSNLAKDRYINTIHVNHDAGAASGADLTTVSGLIGDFHTALANVYPAQVSGSFHTVAAYDMSLPPGSRIPLGQVDFQITTSNAPFPAEVALVITLEAGRAVGVEPMSTRGRMFIGPLSASTGALASDGHSRPNDSFIQLCIDKSVLMINAINAMPGMTVCVASTVQNKQKLADGARKAYPILSVSCDNSWDTQRSRGDRATFRGRTALTEQVLGSFTW